MPEEMSEKPPLPFPETGSFDGTSAVQLIRQLINNQLTGCLITQDGKIKKALYFNQGLPVGAKSNHPEDSLINLALKFKLIDSETYEAIAGQINSNAKSSQSDLIISAGVSEQKLNALAKKQTAIRFADVCTWSKGQYRFKPQLPETIPGLPADAMSIFVEYGKASFKPEAFRQLIAELADKTLKLNAKIASIHKHILQSGDAASIVDSINDSPQTTAQNLLRSPDNDKKTMATWMTAYALSELGVLQFMDGEPGTPPATPAAPEEKVSPESKPVEQVHAARFEAISDEPTGTYPELDQKYAEVKGKNYFEVLGLSEDADAKTVKKMYFKLAKQYHPDKFFDPVSKSPSPLAEQLFSLINRAYEELREDDKRAYYVELLHRGTTDAEEIKKAEDILASELEFQKAQILIRRKKFGEAVTHLTDALELYPGEPDYEVQLFWAIFMSAYPDDNSKCETAVLNMKDLLARGGRASNAESWYLYGRMQKISGNQSGAIKAFEKVLELDKKNKDAARELRALEGTKF